MVDGQEKFAAIDRAFRALAEPRAATTIVLLYCVFHLLFRLLGTSNFYGDEAEAYVLAESWHLFYDVRHPPLFFWLSRIVLEPTGQSPAALFALKYGLMAAGLFLYTVIARNVLRDGFFVVLALLALLVTPTFLFGIHISLTIVVLLGGMICLFIIALFRILEAGRLQDYIALGLIVSLGFWSKYIFIVPLLSFFICIAFLPSLRKRIDPKKLFLSFTIACVLCAPIVWELVTARAHIHGALQRIVLDSYPDSHAGLSLTYFVWPVLSAVEFAVPFALPLLLLFPRSVSLIRQDKEPWGKLLLAANLLSVLMMIAGDLVLGRPGFKFNWFYPILLTLPIALLRGAQLSSPSILRLRVFAVVAAIIILISVPLVFVQYEFGARFCSVCTSFWPAETFASRFSQLGFANGTIYSDTYFEGANLKRYFRNSTVVITDRDKSYYGAINPDALQLAIAIPPGSLAPIGGGVIAKGVLMAPLEKRPTRSANLGYVLVRPGTNP